MLEGLEISEGSFTHTLENKDFRIDSQFYTQEPIKNPKLTYDKIGNCLLNAQYGISIAMNEENIGYPIYRMNEIHSMMCDLEVDKCADISTTELETFELEDRDVLFNRTNSFQWVGRTGIYKKIDDRKFVFASYLVRFIPDQSKILPEYLATFLNTHAGVADIKRRARQSINQTNVNPEEVKAIDIPILSIAFQELLKDCFDQAHKVRIKSKESYQQAEQLLLQEIGLEDFTPSQEPVNVKSFQESFGTSGRLDAEYYQVKYDKVESLLRLYNNGYSLLGEKIEYIRTGEYSESYVAKTLKSKFYLRNNNISKGQILPDDNYAVAADNFLCKAEENEILTSRVGTIGLFGVVSPYLVGSIYSDNVLCFKLTDGLNPYAYSVLFSSMPYQLLMEKLAGGSVQPLITQTSIKTLPIPILKPSVQNEAAELIEESFSLQKQSEHLLDVAKQAVEKAIEENEEVALQWINEQIHTP